MFKNKKVFITILITLLVLISIYGIVSYKNGNILISKIISIKKAETENQIQTDLTNAISALQTEKNGKATLDDITQEWTQTNLSTYTCTFIDDITISGKKLKMESGDVNVKFVINQDLTVTKIEKTYPSIEYQVEETNGNILKVLVIAEDSINGIKRIVCPDGNIIYASGERTKKPIAINYTMDKEQDYLFQIISDNDDDTTTDKTIRINDYYYNITKTLGKGLTISNTVTKVAYNEPYQATITAKENCSIDTISVTMGGEIVDVTDGQINIEHVTGDIVINATSVITINNGNTINYPSNPAEDTEFIVPSYPDADTRPNRGVKLIRASEDLTWTVWKKEGSNYLLTPTTPTATKVKIYFSAGYNNAVQALNAYCRKYYSDPTNGIYARSINLEDIERSMTQAGIDYKATQVPITYPSSVTYYPSVYELEKSGKIGPSDPPYSSDPYAIWEGSLCDADYYDNKIVPNLGMNYTITNYVVNYPNSSHYYDSDTENLLFSETGYGSGYWIATRCFKVSANLGAFCIRCVNNLGGLNSEAVFYSYSSNCAGSYQIYALRPIVSIPESKIMDYIND